MAEARRRSSSKPDANGEGWTSVAHAALGQEARQCSKSQPEATPLQTFPPDEGRMSQRSSGKAHSPRPAGSPAPNKPAEKTIKKKEKEMLDMFFKKLGDGAGGSEALDETMKGDQAPWWAPNVQKTQSENGSRRHSGLWPPTEDVLSARDSISSSRRFSSENSAATAPGGGAKPKRGSIEAILIERQWRKCGAQQQQDLEAKEGWQDQGSSRAPSGSPPPDEEDLPPKVGVTRSLPMDIHRAHRPSWGALSSASNSTASQFGSAQIGSSQVGSASLPQPPERSSGCSTGSISVSPDIGRWRSLPAGAQAPSSARGSRGEHVGETPLPPISKGAGFGADGPAISPRPPAHMRRRPGHAGHAGHDMGSIGGSSKAVKAM